MNLGWSPTGRSSPSRPSRTDSAVPLLTGFMAVIVALRSSDGLRPASRTAPSPRAGRRSLFTVPAATLVILAAGASPRLFVAIATLSILVGAALGFPKGFGDRVAAVVGTPDSSRRSRLCSSGRSFRRSRAGR